MRVFSLADPANPIEVAGYDSPGFAWRVTVEAGIAYLADGRDGGLRVVSVATPTMPAELGAYDTPGDARDVRIDNGYGYVADLTHGIRIVDLASPAMAVEVGFVDTPGDAQRLAIAGELAYLADGQAGLASSVFTPGKNRLAFGVIDAQQRFVYGPSAIYYAQTPEDEAIGPVPAPADVLVTDPAYRSQQAASESDPFAAVYSTEVEFEEPGNWSVLIVTKTGGRTIATPTQIEVAKSSKIPAVGKLLSEKYKKEIKSNLNPDEIVAMGAARMALNYDPSMAAEILVCTPAIRALIRDDKIHQIYSMMQSGKKYGMQTMNDALYMLYMSRDVAWEDCVRASSDPVELARMCGMQLEGDGSAPLTEKKAPPGAAAAGVKR